MELIVGIEDQRQQLQQGEPVLGQLATDQTEESLTVLQNAFMNVKSKNKPSIDNSRKFPSHSPPGGHRLICHDLLEAGGQTFPEESLAMFALSIDLKYIYYNRDISFPLLSTLPFSWIVLWHIPIKPPALRQEVQE